jgi:hypothetical protein
MRLELWAWTLSLAASLPLLGCGDDTAPPPPGMDSGVRLDSSALDGGGSLDGERPMDSGSIDGAVPNMDGSSSTDTGVPGSDSTVPPPDGPVRPSDASLPDPCDSIPATTPCTAEICGESMRCVSNGCGSTHCVPAGHPCGDLRDCPSGAVCASTPRGRACVRPLGCTDSRECPLGFSCDGGACVDRRIACGPLSPCPYGYVCGGTDLGGAPFCVRLHTRCFNTAACPFPGAQCTDLTGDGERECTITGSCSSNSDCGTGQQCSYQPTTRSTGCVTFGPCQGDADCASGSTCSDLWGDGIGECAKVGGSCTSTAACTAFALCATPESGSPPSCMGTPF